MLNEGKDGMNWYKKVKESAAEGTVTASPPPYSQNDAIQNREDLAPSMLRKKRRKKRRDRRNDNNYNN